MENYESVKNYFVQCWDYFYEKYLEWSKSNPVVWLKDVSNDELFDTIFPELKMALAFDAKLKLANDYGIPINHFIMMNTIAHLENQYNRHGSYAFENYQQFKVLLDQCDLCYSFTNKSKYTLEEITKYFKGVEPIEAYLAIRDLINGNLSDDEIMYLVKWKGMSGHGFSIRELDRERGAFILAVVSRYLMQYGVEEIRLEGFDNGPYWNECVGLYMNTGDSYSPTIVYNTINETFLLTTYGDFIETVENNRSFFE